MEKKVGVGVGKKKKNKAKEKFSIVLLLLSRFWHRTRIGTGGFGVGGRDGRLPVILKRDRPHRRPGGNFYMHIEKDLEMESSIERWKEMWEAGCHSAVV